MDERRRREKIVFLVGATAAAAGFAYLVYKHVICTPVDPASDAPDAQAQHPARSEFPSAEPAQQQPSQPAARIHVNKQALNAEKNDQLSKTEAASHEASAPVGKKGMRWWYVGNKGKDRKAGIAAQQKALEDARRVTEEAMKAAQTGDLQTLTRLADQGWPIDSRDKFGGTALHWAAGKGRENTVKFLLERKADPLARLYKGGGRGRTPLHYAARNGHLEMCKLLVEEGRVPPDAMTHDSTPPLHLAVWKGRLETAEWLLTVCNNLHYVNDYGCDTSHWAALSGSVSTAKWLISKGVTFRTTNQAGHTCMHKAAQLGHIDLVQFLVNDLHIHPRRVEPDGEGNSPADLAREAGHDSLALWLDALA